MKCYIAADHAGFALKEEIKQWLKAQQIVFEDLGTFDTQRVDYPLYAQKLAQHV
ncbi:MAG: RpiB/LacA/LacB family sugar-phosphate isomerase, partial [Helicobacter sp.]|nr:RpiB/LacA/LacB family sugar-phosphate isomerase [Helicobacter sp.]